MSGTLDDLSLLPTPDIIEPLDFETVLARKKSEFTDRMSAFGVSYDVAELETDPGIILLQEAAFSEILLRARGNDIARSRYLYFARGSEVDHLGLFYDCARLPGESDERYKSRIVLAIQGRSTGGTGPRYKAVAMGASLRVADAVVYTDGLDPTVRIAVFSTDVTGVADAALLDAVRAAVTADSVRMVNDRIEVRTAVVVVVPVMASLTLLPDTSTDLLTSLAASLPLQWASEGGLGRDLMRDWIRARLMASGVHSVTLATPTADSVMQPFEAVRIGAVTLTLAGRSF